jgi:signal transduction histidine kinase
MTLRLRLLLTTGAVVASALLAMALMSSRLVRYELRELARQRPRFDATALARALAHSRDLRAVRDRVAPGQELVLVDEAGKFVASTLNKHITTRRLGHGQLQMDVDDNGRLSRFLIGGVETPVAGGYVYVVPAQKAPEDPVHRVNRSLAAIVAGVGLLALLATAVIARRIVGPIEELTEAARKMEAGQSPQPVTARSRDEVGALARSFNAMAARVAATEELRRTMVNDVAHELRTPLTSLRCTLESIEDGLRPADAATLGGLARDVALLQRLVDDLQTIAMAEAGQLPLHRRPLRLRDEVERAAATIGADVIIDVAPDLQLDADPDRLQQILLNLLRNAVTHTPPSGTIRVQASPDTIEVRDSGIGIAPEALPHVFDRFYRADASRQRATGGAGLGLAIVKNLVTAHGWTIEATSAEGRGAAFVIRTR